MLNAGGKEAFLFGMARFELLRLVQLRVRQWTFMLKHLSKIAHINEAAASRTAHEMLGFVLGLAVTPFTHVLYAPNCRGCDP
jgi:hypothetical protein